MNRKLRTRWIVLGCVWLAVLGLTGWNLARIDDVAAARRATERLRREVHFQRHNAQRLEQMLARHKALFMDVESLDLGMVSLRDRARALAAAFGIEDLAVDAEMNQIDGDRIPCRISAMGGFENTVGFLTALNGYDYLIPRQIMISPVPSAPTVRLEITCFIQFKIMAPAPAETLPNVTTQADAKGRPL
jgi:hypothetical protein